MIKRTADMTDAEYNEYVAAFLEGSRKKKVGFAGLCARGAGFMLALGAAWGLLILGVSFLWSAFRMAGFLVMAVLP